MVGVVWICIRLERHIVSSRLVMGRYIWVGERTRTKN